MNVLKNKGVVVKKVKIDKANKEIISIVLKDNLGVDEGQATKKKYKYDVKLNKFSLSLKKEMKCLLCIKIKLLRQNI